MPWIVQDMKQTEVDNKIILFYTRSFLNHITPAVYQIGYEASNVYTKPRENKSGSLNDPAPNSQISMSKLKREEVKVSEILLDSADSH